MNDTTGTTLYPAYFVRGLTICPVKPVIKNNPNYSEHTILLNLTPHRSTAHVQIANDALAEARGNEWRLAITPEDAKKLIGELQKMIE